MLCALAAGWLYVHGKMVQWERTAEAYRTFAGTEKDWILSCQTDDGLILYRQWDPEEYREEQTVFPYFSTIAALGLLSGTVTEEHAEGALRYQQWYLNHLNTSAQDLQNGRGTVYDCRVIREGASLREESLQTYDSVDSYAAMFLLLVDRYAQAVSDELLFSRTEDILLVLEALLNTIGPNGLSYAKSEYPVQYLMDNSEVYAGLCAAARILERMDPSGQLEQVRTMALQLREAMDLLLWNHTGGHYEVGLFEGDLPISMAGRASIRTACASCSPFVLAYCRPIPSAPRSCTISSAGHGVGSVWSTSAGISTRSTGAQSAMRRPSCRMRHV